MNISEKTKDFLGMRQKSYHQVFGDGEAVQEVLKDLERFCRAHESCFHADARVSALLEGRREVLLRIQDHLKLSTTDLLKKYTNKGSEV